MKVLISRLTNQGQEPQGPGRGLKFITRVTQEVQSSSHIYIENNFDNIFFWWRAWRLHFVRIMHRETHTIFSSVIPSPVSPLVRLKQGWHFLGIHSWFLRKKLELMYYIYDQIYITNYNINIGGQFFLVHLK